MDAHPKPAADAAAASLLAAASRGTAFFAARLDALSDGELDGDSLLPGWTRRHVVAHIGFNAFALSRLADWARTGEETAMYASPDARNGEIETGAHLDPSALRALFVDSAEHLDRAWRALPDSHWSHLVRTAQGAMVPAWETIWMRTREVWVHSVDLNNGAAFSDIPVDVLERMLGDITDAWRKRGEDAGLRLEVSGARASRIGDLANPDAEVVSGSLADITAWACGRGSAGVTSTRRESPVAPHWI